MKSSQTGMVALAAGLVGMVIGSVGTRLVVGDDAGPQAETFLASFVGSADDLPANGENDDNPVEGVDLPAEARDLLAEEKGEETDEEPAPEKKPVASEASILARIDSVAAHPEDPQNPTHVRGANDTELSSMPSQEIKDLLDEGIPVAEQRTAEPRYLFALGRAAYTHGYRRDALHLLTKAASFGSPAAKAYLGQIEKEDHKYLASVSYLKEAVNGGFRPARDWLDEAEQLLAENTFDFARFNNPELLRTLHSGDISSLNKDPSTRLMALFYIKQMAETMEGADVRVQTGAAIYPLIDPALAANASLEVGTPENMQTIMAMGVAIMANSAGDGWQVLEKAHQRGDMNIGDIFGALMTYSYSNRKAQTFLETLARKAELDGLTLADLYTKRSRADVTKVYEGMKKFVFRQ